MGNPTGESTGDLTGDLISEPMGESTGEPADEPISDPIGEPTGEPDEPIDQYCSSCNQKKPFINFGRFLTCNMCRQRNRKANQARHIKQKALLNKNS